MATVTPGAVLCLLLAGAAAFKFQVHQQPPTRRVAALRLAPRAELEAEFRRVAAGAPELSEQQAAASTFIAELLGNGDLRPDELSAMFASAATTAGALSLDGFVNLCEDIDDLFEEEEEEEEDEDVVSPEAALLKALAALPEGVKMRTEFESGDDEDDDLADPVVAAAAALAEGGAVDADSAFDLLLGDWDLAYVSSQSFAFNGGYTGVAKTTPGGAAFVSLRQSFQIRRGGAVVATMVEHLRTAVGNADLPVTVTADWSFKTSTEPVTGRKQLLVAIVPRSVEYGLLKVDGASILLA